MNFRFLLLLSSALFLFSCDNDVMLLEDSAPVPIVYGLYNASSELQAVSISKSFQFGEEGGALAAAKQVDSLYYGVDEIVAYAENSRNANRVTMTRVNFADQGLPRQEGVFPTDPNYFYTYDTTGLEVRPGDTIRIRVEKDGEVLVTGNAPVLPELSFLRSREPLDFYPFSSSAPYSFSWDVNDANVMGASIGTYEFGFNIFLTETAPDGTERSLTFYWAAGRNLDGNQSVFRARIDGFYDFLNAQLRQRIDGYSYTIPAVKMVITGGDDSFSAYRDLIIANRGITSTGELPPFSNVPGGIGLFGGITQLNQETIAGLTPDSADALKDRCQGIDFGL